MPKRSHEIRLGPVTAIPLFFLPWAVGVVVILKAIVGVILG